MDDGVPINDAPVLMGHEKASTTLDFYVHPKRFLDSRVDGLFADFLLTSDEAEDSIEGNDGAKDGPGLRLCGVGLSGLELDISAQALSHKGAQLFGAVDELLAEAWRRKRKSDWRSLWSTFVSENHRRPSGGPPYWPTGTQIMWRYGSLGTGSAIKDTSVPHFAEPMTVVRDDADGLVAWLAAGTPVLRPARTDGLGIRDDKGTMFTTETVQDVGVWTDYNVLRIAPTGRPWSMWVFFAQDTGEFAGWYGNLEQPHVRDDHVVYSCDHVLDLVIEPDRTVARKDEDELDLAVAQGCYDAATAAAIEANATEVETIISSWGPPFCDGWEHFRPDPAWPIPDLPGHH